MLQLKVRLSMVLLFVFITACNKQKEITVKDNTLFSLVNSEFTGITFKNTVKENLYFNFLNYSYIYNGTGVAVGDINNDGFEDLYFTSNQESNKLYLNQGGFKFKDITESAGVSDANGWSTGVSMIDINNDGWLDIYVCKSGSLENHDLRRNKLFLNQKDNSFKEVSAEYGLDHFGFSTQAYFFDYDLDNDLDMYLVNHRADFRNNITINPELQKTKEAFFSDQLFRNDGNTFKNVTKEAGLENKAWGLSASLGDFNNDNLPDIYVANDFLEPDFLYINQGDGTFKDEVLNRFKHISANSMGSDFADLNNDLKPDLVVLDMMAEDHIRGKQNMATMSTDNFNLLVNSGYHHQYMSNMLQLNNGDGHFSEIGQLAGIAKTDWSWAPLIADFDNDGYNDLFVSNGIENDLSNQDFRNQMRRNIQNRKKISLEEAIAMMPSEKLSNYSFKNKGNLKFENTTSRWGINQEVNSTGAVYADLDNDGDLDLVLANQSDEASVYKNNAKNNYLMFQFKGAEENINGIGATINVYSKNLKQSKTLYLSRGYQSSVTNKLHFGLGNLNSIDSVIVVWPDTRKQKLTNVSPNTLINLDYNNANTEKINSVEKPLLFESVDPIEIGINYIQKENSFNDFELQLLLPQKQSEKGAPIAVADINNDGLDDFFVGNASGASGALYMQNEAGGFESINQNLFEADKLYEDTSATFLDFDNDNDLDLYVSSGGYEMNTGNKLLQDRLYVNNGYGQFTKTVIPEIFTNTKKVIFADYDKDGDQDAFVCGGVIHGKYPLAHQSLLLENDKGMFKNITHEVFDDFSGINMVNDAVFCDYDNDNDLDLIVVGEWMPIIIFENVNKKYEKLDLPVLENTNGWNQTIKSADLNNDGHVDFLIGNWGGNNKFHPKTDKPLHIYADYFDDNKTFDVVLSKVSKTGELLPVRGKECSSQQNPFINDKLKTFKEFANSTLPDIYGAESLKNAVHFKVETFKSIILKNTGDGHFEINELPEQVQFGPVLSFEIEDLNNDGRLDVLGVGNVYDAEVETIRYDASKGFVLLGADKGKLINVENSGFVNYNEAKSISKIIINGQIHFIILNKNAPLNILRVNN